ncbi:MAG: hypothetical protein ABI249_10130 [Ornithinibacter sp.]
MREGAEVTFGDGRCGLRTAAGVFASRVTTSGLVVTSTAPGEAASVGGFLRASRAAGAAAAGAFTRAGATGVAAVGAFAEADRCVALVAVVFFVAAVFVFAVVFFAVVAVAFLAVAFRTAVAAARVG